MTTFHTMVSAFLSRYLYIITSKVERLECNYTLHLVQNVEEYKEDNIPIWADSLCQMVHYDNFGPTFSTLTLIVSEQVYQDYLDLHKDSVERLDNFIEEWYLGE